MGRLASAINLGNYWLNTAYNGLARETSIVIAPYVNSMNLIITSRILGIVLTVSGLSLLFNKKGVRSLIEETTQSQGLLWLFGFFALVMGSILVVFNNVWSSGMQLLVTIIGWLTLIKGAFILLFPNTAISLSKKWDKNGLFAVSGLGALVLGLILLYAGFMQRSLLL